jgi:DnaJ-class molecular chaperone
MSEKKSAATEGDSVSDRASENTLLKYALAAMTLGAAFGNIYSVRRLRSSMKNVKTPYNHKSNNEAGAENAGAAGTSTSASGNNSRVNEEWARRAADEQARQRQRVKNYVYQQENFQKMKDQYEAWQRRKFSGERPSADGLSRDMRSHLTALGMEARFPSKGEVKEAYRKAALKYHPDRLDSDDPKAKDYEKRFLEASVAYKALLDHLENLENKDGWS